jgi:hypothetical protein
LELEFKNVQSTTVRSLPTYRHFFLESSLFFFSFFLFLVPYSSDFDKTINEFEGSEYKMSFTILAAHIFNFILYIFPKGLALKVAISLTGILLYPKVIFAISAKSM